MRSAVKYERHLWVRKRASSFAAAILLFSACGEESRCDKVCGNDYGFERGDEENRVCFCETLDGRVYGPVPVGEEVQAPKHECSPSEIFGGAFGAPQTEPVGVVPNPTPTNGDKEPTGPFCSDAPPQ